MSELSLDLERVGAASVAIPKVFVDTPQYISDGLSRMLGLDVILKVETVNPVGSAAGRAAEWWFECNPDERRIVCPSVSDLGVAMARAGRVRGVEVDLFGPLVADRGMVDLLRRGGTTVQLDGNDLLEASVEARRYAAVVDARLVEDETHIEFVEGAATMAAELQADVDSMTEIYVPADSGFLAVGVGQWCHQMMPSTRVVAVVVGNGPGPVGMATTSIDQTVHVDNESIDRAREALARHEGLRASEIGAAPLAAAMLSAPQGGGSTVVVAVTSRDLG